MPKLYATTIPEATIESLFCYIHNSLTAHVFECCTGPLQDLQGKHIPKVEFFGICDGVLRLATTFIDGTPPSRSSSDKALAYAEEVRCCIIRVCHSIYIVGSLSQSLAFYSKQAVVQVSLPHQVYRCAAACSHTAPACHGVWCVLLHGCCWCSCADGHEQGSWPHRQCDAACPCRACVQSMHEVCCMVTSAERMCWFKVMRYGTKHNVSAVCTQRFWMPVPLLSSCICV